MERTNIRYIDFDKITDKVDFISIDVAFISLKLVLPVAQKIITNGGKMVALIKPQFEAGREDVGKKGVVRNITIHQKVIKDILEFTKKIGLSIEGLDFSPIKGPEGNIEFLMYLSKKAETTSSVSDDDIINITEESHKMS